MVASSNRNRALASWAAWCGAAMWAMGLIAFAYMPAYSTSVGTHGGQVSSGTQSLVDVNGGDVLLVVAVPLAVTVLVGVALLLRSRRGVLVIAWALTAVLGVFNLIALLSVGVLILPVTAALVGACAAATAWPRTRFGTVQ